MARTLKRLDFDGKGAPLIRDFKHLASRVIARRRCALFGELGAVPTALDALHQRPEANRVIADVVFALAHSIEFSVELR